MENLKQLLTFGNLAYPKTTAIFNMCSATKCPSKEKGLCRIPDKCYAMKAEKNYPNVVPHRDRQEKYWVECTAEQFAEEFLEAIKKKRTKINMLRFNSSGDFKTQQDLDKFAAISNILSEHGILVFCNTARRDLDFSDHGKALIKGSSFMVDMNFRASYDPQKEFESLSKENKKVRVCEGNCIDCDFCFQPENRGYIVLEQMR